MDLINVLEDLRHQKEKVDRAIASLEALQRNMAGAPGEPMPRRRGRKFMDESERQVVSRRMKTYWAARRQQHVATSKDA